MIELKFKITEEIISNAHKHELLRDRCKDYLIKAGMDFDKFTVVKHDSFVGFISELAVKDYINERCKEKNIEITTWEDNFDIEKIVKIIESNSASKEDTEYLKEYFYDNMILNYNHIKM